MDRKSFAKDAPTMLEAYNKVLSAAIECGGVVDNFIYETDDYEYRLDITQNRRIYKGE